VHGGGDGFVTAKAAFAPAAASSRESPDVRRHLYSASYGVGGDIVVGLRIGLVGKTCAGGFELAGML
jgi:hypothetical protein